MKNFFKELISFWKMTYKIEKQKIEARTLKHQEQHSKRIFRNEFSEEKVIRSAKSYIKKHNL